MENKPLNILNKFGMILKLNISKLLDSSRYKGQKIYTLQT